MAFRLLLGSEMLTLPPLTAGLRGTRGGGTSLTTWGITWSGHYQTPPVRRLFKGGSRVLLHLVPSLPLHHSGSWERQSLDPPDLQDSLQVTPLVSEFYKMHPQEGPLILFRWVVICPSIPPSLLSFSWGKKVTALALSQRQDRQEE